MGIADKTCFIIFFRVSSDFVVKIADFGLSKDVYHKDYYRRDEKSSTPLPIKWMALESLRNNGEFSSKSDVVRIYIYATEHWYSYNDLQEW